MLESHSCEKSQRWEMKWTKRKLNLKITLEPGRGLCPGLCRIAESGLNHLKARKTVLP